MFFGDHEHTCLLAYCIGEWRTALDHIEAAEAAMGWSFERFAIQRIKDELRNLLNQWATVSGLPPSDADALLADARAYATTHVSEIDSLLQKKGVS